MDEENHLDLLDEELLHKDVTGVTAVRGECLKAASGFMAASLEDTGCG